MSRSALAFLPVLALALVLSSGCSRGLATALPSVPNLDLPEPIPPRPPMAPDVATLVYPETDKTMRDPFLSVAEQAIADDRKDLTPTMKPVLDPLAKIHVAGLPFQKVIKQLHEQVHGIILGAPNVFMFKGHGYEEGDVIEGTDWVVLSIQETGIKLRSKDGSGSDYLQFRTEPSIQFEFKGDSEAPAPAALCSRDADCSPSELCAASKCVARGGPR